MKKIAFLFAVVLLFMACEEESKEVKPGNEVDLITLINFLEPYVKISASESGSNLLYPLDSLCVYLSEPLEVEKEYDNKQVFKCQLEQLEVTALYNSQKIEGITYRFNAHKDTLVLDLTEKMEADRSYELCLVFNYYEKIGDKWEKVQLEDSQESTSVITKRFKSAKFDENVYDCSKASLAIINEIELYKEVFPEISLNYSIDKVLIVSKDRHAYSYVRAVMKEIAITQDGTSVNTDNVWVSPLQMRVLPVDNFQENTAYQLNMKVAFEEKVNNEWVPLKNAAGEIILEEKSLSFTTGTFPNELISDAFIAASYPLERQFNFYPGEYAQGYIEFLVDPARLSQIEAMDNLQFRFTLLPDNIETAVVNGRYSQTDKTIWFDFPTNLQHEKPYRIELISNSKVVYSNEFRVSKYQRLFDKLPADREIRFLYDVELEGSIKDASFLGTTIYLDEPDECFDYYEIKGFREQPLMKITALLDQWDWYNQSPYKYIYDHYPIIPGAKLSRDLSKEGLLALNYFEIWQVDFNRKLTDDEITSGVFEYEADKSHIINEIPLIWAKDYLETREALLDRYSKAEDIKDEMLRKIYEMEYFPTPSSGDYSIKVEYVLPGKDIVTSSQIIKITDDIEMNDDDYWD
ncbi:hypothetical protein DMA11_13630 [Marinilabiliaceae bacterium JC017]|nr:hypothetical protein DMA11_13630 [Marinilabiliaceae bacterium JC017]